MSAYVPGDNLMMLRVPNSTKSGVPISVCGRLCYVSNTTSLANVQSELQAFLGMHEQEFDLSDSAGKRLVTDQELQAAVQGSLVPLQAGLSDASVHLIENRREELAQMQWKVLRDKLQGCNSDVLALSTQVSELQQRIQLEAKEREKVVEALRADIGNQLNQDRAAVEANMHQLSEQIHSFSSLVNAEQNKREYAHKVFDNQVQDLRNALDADRADRRQESDKHLAMLREGTVGLDAQRHALESVEQRHMLDLQNIRSELAQASRKVTAFADEQLELLRLSNEELARKLKTLESDTHRKLAEVQAGNEQAMKNVSAAEAHSHEIDARLSQTAMNHSERLLKASARQDELLEAVEHAKAERNNLDVKLNRSAAQSKEQEDTLAKVDEALRKLVEKESGLIREELQSVHRKMASQQTKIADIELRWLDNHPSMESSLVASGKNADASKVASSPQTSDESPAVFEPTTPGLAAVSGHASPPVMGSFILPQAKPWTSFCKLPSNSQAQGVRTIAGNVASGTASPLPGGVYSPRAPVTVHTVPATLSSHRLLATPDRSPNIKYTRSPSLDGRHTATML